MLPRARLALVAAVAVGAGALLSGCSTTVSMTPAAGSNDPLCAEVMVRLPATLSGQARQWTDAQATAAWGAPTAILFTCGGAEPGPTTLRCEEVGGVDWVIDESDAPRFKVTTYGRSPAVELFFDTSTDDGTGVSSRAVLDAISPLVSQSIPADRACVPRTEATPAADG